MDNLSTERLKEITGVATSILTLLNSIEEEELEAVAKEFQLDSAIGVFLDPSAYQDGRRFRLNDEANRVCGHLLTLKRALAAIPKTVL